MNLDYIQHLKLVTKKQSDVNKKLVSSIKLLKKFNDENNLITMMQPPENSKANQYRRACDVKPRGVKCQNTQ